MINIVNTASGTKKTIIITAAIILLLIILGVGGYILWNQYAKFKTKNVFDNIADMAGDITDSATRGVLPSLETNLLENKPDLNPADKVNPYADIKTNPF